ncbi:MAG: hypothetical protein L3J98_10835 [Gammaproteobacteria bacterium]|nr:hypothetical protein [Gammaproteobacteria bacterium]
MNINLHIERLILDGIPVNKENKPKINAAVKSELSHLLSNSKTSTGLPSNRSIHSIHGGNISVKPNQNPTILGHKIASAIYQGVKK